MVSQPVGQVIAWVAWAFLEWTILMVQATAGLPFASLEVGRFDVPLLALYYLLLFGATRVSWRTLREHVTLRPAIALGVAVVVGIWIWNLALTAPDGKTHVEFLDAGSAATFVRTPRGAKILIDGGANPSIVLSALGQRLPFWDRSLDLLVLTNPDDDHLAGLVAALERYDTQQIIQVNAPAKPTAAYLKWRELIAQKRVPSSPARAGLQIAVDRDVVIEILHPSEDADDSRVAIARLRAGAIAFLFADSAGTDDQSVLLSSGTDAASTALIAPRKIAPGFFDAVNPQFAILFGSYSAREKSPADLLAALSRAIILRTDERGTIEMIVSEQSLAVKMAR
jgi:competence protein ComEC